MLSNHAFNTINQESQRKATQTDEPIEISPKKILANNVSSPALNTFKGRSKSLERVHTQFTSQELIKTDANAELSSINQDLQNIVAQIKQRPLTGARSRSLTKAQTVANTPAFELVPKDDLRMLS
jgi:hypothetical protein